jgi:Uma2 family endonuclease
MLLSKFAEGNGEVFITPLDLYIDSKNVFQPDLIYISNANQGIITERGIKGVPDLIVEIISPSNIFSDRNTKLKAYREFGVNEYWIVDPGNKTVEIYLAKQRNAEVPYVYLAEEGQLKSTVLPGINFDLKEVFLP